MFACIPLFFLSAESVNVACRYVHEEASVIAIDRYLLHSALSSGDAIPPHDVHTAWFVSLGDLCSRAQQPVCVSAFMVDNYFEVRLPLSLQSSKHSSNKRERRFETSASHTSCQQLWPMPRSCAHSCSPAAPLPLHLPSRRKHPLHPHSIGWTPMC